MVVHFFRVAVLHWIFPRKSVIIWGAGPPQGSDRYARIARVRISNLQRAVARSIRQGPQGDSLDERETLKEFQNFMQQKNVAPETLCAISAAISSWDPVPDFPVPAAREVEFDPEVSPIIDDEASLFPQLNQKFQLRRRREVAKPLFGQSSWEKIPKWPGLASGRTFPQGFFYICPSGKRSIRTVHRLGACYALPDIDCLRWSYSGTNMPKSSEYDVVCTLCSRQGVASSTVSSGTESSSSTIEVEARGSRESPVSASALEHNGQGPITILPKTGFSLTFLCGFAPANQGMSQFQGSQGAILEFTPAGHICCGFSPFTTRPLQLKIPLALPFSIGYLAFIMPFLAVSLKSRRPMRSPLNPRLRPCFAPLISHEELITILRVRNVLDREIFSSLEMNEEKFRETIASACGIDNTNFEHKLETAKLVKAWRTRRSSPRSMRFRKLPGSQFRCCLKIGPVSCVSLKKDLVAIFMRPNYRHSLTTKRFRKKTV